MKAARMARDVGSADSSDPNIIATSLVFVPHGDPLPVEWLRRHPDAVRIPATLVPRVAVATLASSPPPGSFVPPPRTGHWRVDRHGRAWPRTAFGQPQRPLSEFRPGQRAPGEAIRPEYRADGFNFATFDPIASWRAIQPVVADPAAAAGLKPPKTAAAPAGLLTPVQATVREEEESRRLLEEFLDPLAEARAATAQLKRPLKERALTSQRRRQP
jgi:hypothetical protein